jgi:predicted DNA-binding protein (MmcQ/YjbR family)
MAALTPIRRIEADLRRFALSYPEAYEDRPWGERVAKVRKKIFVFLGVPDKVLHLTVKLPDSGALALSLPFVSPTGYGLGKSGWVTATFGSRQGPPVGVLKQWIDESYRAIAPRKLVATLSSARPDQAATSSHRKPVKAGTRARATASKTRRGLR